MVVDQLGHSDHEMIVFRSQISKELLPWTSERHSGLLGRLADRILWGFVLKGKGVQEDLTFFNKKILIRGAGCPHPLKGKQRGETILDEQRAMFRTQESKESL